MLGLKEITRVRISSVPENTVALNLYRSCSVNTCLICVWLISVTACSTSSHLDDQNKAHGLSSVDRYTLAGEKHLVRDYSPLDLSGNINVVVEIPTGTNEKWEVDKTTGELKWEIRNGKPRIVTYLGYPGNYGMIPATLLPRNMGGDGDPLDVLVLGPALPRGSIISARAIGILKLLDRGEQDDKIIAVMSESHWGEVTSMEQLEQHFEGVSEIIEIWFSNYKGPGKMESQGYADATQARKIIRAAIDAYEEQLDK